MYHSQLRSFHAVVVHGGFSSAARHLNLSHPEHSAALQAPLAREAGGWGQCVGPDGQPVFRDTNDPDYQLVLRHLREGVVAREQPGVHAILRAARAAPGDGDGE